jgi:MFS family permease
MSQEKHLLLEKDSREKVGGGTTTTSVSAIWRSFFFLTIGAFLSFCAYNGSQNIVSSLKMKSVQGSTAVAILYLFFTFFCLLAPFIVQKVGAKNVLMLQLLFLTLYTLSFIYPRWYTLYIAAALSGIGAGPFWVCQGLYMTDFANQYDNATEATKGGAEAEDEDAREPASSAGLFQGYFFGIFQLTQVFGNLESSLFETVFSEESSLFFFYAIMIAFGIVLVAFVPKLSSGHGPNAPCKPLLNDPNYSIELENSVNEPERRDTVKDDLWTTLRILKDPKIIALLPAFFACGLEQAVMFGDVSTLVSRRFGHKNVGYVLMTFGIGDSIAASLVGRLSDKYGKIPFFVAGAITHILCCVYFFVFGQTENQMWYPLLCVAFLWGVGDAIWLSILTTVCGELYTNESDRGGAFSNNKLMQSIAMTVGFFITPSSTTFVPKLICLFVFMVLALVGVLVSKPLRRLDRRVEG